MTDLAALVATPGANDLAYADPAFPDRPLVLRSARPRDFDADTPVLFVHHGVLRNGGDYRDYWLPLVDAAKLLVVVPEFPNDSFPGAPWYNFGNRTDADGAPNPRDRWTYAVTGRVFEALRAAGLTNRRQYGMFGHSAGSQYIHRMMSLGFRDKVAAAVAANAGTYAMPVLDVDFPYGLGGTPVDEAALKAWLQFPLTVMAGTLDIDTESEHFPKEAMAMAQGGTRFERAHRYVETAERQAARLGVACGWRVIDVPGVDHDGKRMSAAAAPLLSKALHAAD